MAVVANGGQKEVKKEEDESYRQCIMDLIRENERLCKCWRLCILFSRSAPRPPGVLGSTVSNLSYMLMISRVLGSLLSAPYYYYSLLSLVMQTKRLSPSPTNEKRYSKRYVTYNNAPAPQIRTIPPM